MSRRVGLRSMGGVSGAPPAILETRYFRHALHTVNGLSAKEFGTTQTSSGSYYTDHSGNGTGNLTVYWGIRVWKRASDGTETEITSGTPVAVASRSTDQAAPAEQSAVWTCPRTSLDPTDAIVVRTYRKFGSGSYGLMFEFISDQLNVSALAKSEWTVYYWTSRLYQAGFNRTAQSWEHGTPSMNARVESFGYYE